MFSIPFSIQAIALILFGIVLIVHLLSCLCGKSKRTVSVPMVVHYTAIGKQTKQQGEPVRTLYYSNETGNKLMD